MKVNKLLKYFLVTLSCSFVGYIICKYSFLPICRFFAYYFDCDYAVIALGFYLLIFIAIAVVLKIVRADITTETFYKNNFTPVKAIMLAAVMMFFHVILIEDTIKLDKEGKILSLYQQIFSEKSVNNNRKELKNETNIKTKKNNDFNSDSDADRMRYRD